HGSLPSSASRPGYPPPPPPLTSRRSAVLGQAQQVGERAAGVHQVVVGPPFGDAATFHDDDVIGDPGVLQAVCDDDGDAVGGDRLDLLEDAVLTTRVHLGGGLVQDQQRRA